MKYALRKLGIDNDANVNNVLYMPPSIETQSGRKHGDFLHVNRNRRTIYLFELKSHIGDVENGKYISKLAKLDDRLTKANDQLIKIRKYLFDEKIIDENGWINPEKVDEFIDYIAYKEQYIKVTREDKNPREYSLRDFARALGIEVDGLGDGEVWQAIRERLVGVDENGNLYPKYRVEFVAVAVDWVPQLLAISEKVEVPGEIILNACRLNECPGGKK